MDTEKLRELEQEMRQGIDWSGGMNIERTHAQWADRLRDILAAQPPKAEVPNGKLVGWWNGITPGRDGLGIPSIRWGADAENSGHDIPLYDGYNPIHYVTPITATPTAAADELAALLTTRQEVAPVAWMREGATTVMHNVRFDKPASGPWIPLYTHPAHTSEAMDAARYRWLRDKGDSAYIEWGGKHSNSAHGGELDTAIDAAMRQEAE